MTLEYLNTKIDEALKDAEFHPGAMFQTNILNAEYALGKYYALLDLIDDLFGIDALIETRDRTTETVDYLSERVNQIYDLRK